MKARRHHNNKGVRQIRRGKTRHQVETITKKLNVPVVPPPVIYCAGGCGYPVNEPGLCGECACEDDGIRAGRAAGAGGMRVTDSEKISLTFDEWAAVKMLADRRMKAANGHSFITVLKTRCRFCGRSREAKGRCGWWFQTFLSQLDIVMMNLDRERPLSRVKRSKE